MIVLNVIMIALGSKQLSKRIFWGSMLALTAVMIAFGSNRSTSSVQQVKRGAFFNLSTDGKLLVFSANGSGGSDLYLLHLDVGHVERLTESPGCEMYPSFSPDGRRVVFSLTTPDGKGPASLYIQSLDDTHRKRVTTSTTYDAYPSFSRDGRRIVFARANQNRPYSMGGYVWDDWDVYTVSENGTDLHQITRDKYRNLYVPHLIPDASKIVFAADPLGSAESTVYTVDANGAIPPVPLTRTGKNYDPSPSPDGSQLVFISDRAKPFSYEVWRMGTDETNAVQVTSTNSYNRFPQFTPDGKRIFFLSDPTRSDRNELWRVDVDGKNLHLIADSSLFDDPLKWKPQNTHDPHTETPNP